jgi:hypothetical protein
LENHSTWKTTRWVVCLNRVAHDRTNGVNFPLFSTYRKSHIILEYVWRISSKRVSAEELHQTSWEEPFFSLRRIRGKAAAVFLCMESELQFTATTPPK